MNIHFTFKNIDASEQLKDYCRSRFEKLSKYLGHTENVELQVNMSVEKFRHVAEVTLDSDFIHISAFDESADMYSTIDMVWDKLEAQLRRMREKQKGRGKKTDKNVRLDVISYGESSAGTRERTIVESDQFQPKPMDVDEAAEQLTAIHDEFVVFINAETDRLNVLYRLKSGDFGLIDPGFH